MRSACGLTLGISGPSGRRSENLDLTPTRRSRERPSSSPSCSRGPSASLRTGELDLRCLLLCAVDVDWWCSSGSGDLDRR
eukprot:2561552-Pleurochrysis_carterae.AAC.1